MNSILKEDLQDIINSSLINWKKLRNKTILITGATGLIGSILTKALIIKNSTDNLNLNMVLLIRKKEEAEKIFGKNKYISYIVSSVEEYIPRNIKIDYIIHGASPTKSKFFVNNPVETMDISILGTKRILEQARISIHFHR